MKPKFEEQAADTPDLAQLREDFQWCISRSGSNIFTRQRINYETRNCIWRNQTSDGRKWAPKDANEDEVWPWPGASDIRYHLTDNFVIEDLAILKTVWRRNRVLVSGTESNDAKYANRLTQLLRWLVYTQMKEVPREMKLAANWLLERGNCLMGVFWNREQQLGYEQIDMETVVNLAANAKQFLEAGTVPDGLTPEQLAEAVVFPQLVRDPALEEKAAAVLARHYPDVKASRVRQIVRDLREEGVASFPRPYTVKDRPAIVALSTNDDVFLPPESVDLQSSRVIFRKELLSEASLRERVGSHGWDEAWVNEVIETQRGVIMQGGQVLNYRQNRTRRFNGLGVVNTEHLFEVAHAWRRLTDDDGVPGVFYTVFHAGLTGKSTRRQKSLSYGWHGLLGYDHGEYPFVSFDRETRSRLMDDSRGYGEIASTWQNQLKATCDMNLDRGSISTLPPSYHPEGQPPDQWGPGAQVPTNRPESYGFFEGPRFDAGSEYNNNMILQHARQYFGRVLPDGENQIEAGAMRQSMADDWMWAWQDVYTQILKLEQQFGSDEIYYRVVGSNKGQALRTSRDEIQGEFDVAVSYNVDDLDMEKVKAKLGLIQEALAWDTSGRVDRDEVLTVGFELLDPNMGERVLKPSESASQQELDDEANVLSRMYAGVFTDVRPGQAYQARLQYLDSQLQGNRKINTTYQSDPNFRELVDKRRKQLGFQLQQQQNAVIGRLGA